MFARAKDVCFVFQPFPLMVQVIVDGAVTYTVYGSSDNLQRIALSMRAKPLTDMRVSLTTTQQPQQHD